MKIVSFHFLLAFLLCVLIIPQTKGQVAIDEDLKEKVLQTQKALWFAHILRQTKTDQVIKNLKIEITKVPVYLMARGTYVRPLVMVKMKYPKEQGELLIQPNVPLRKTEVEGEYVLYAYLRSPISEIPLVVKKPNSPPEKEVLYLFAPEARQFRIQNPFKTTFFKLGMAWAFYQQSSYGTFVSSSLQIGLRYLSPEKGKRLGLLGDFDLTVFTYDSSPEDLNPQFWEGLLAGTLKYKIFSSPRWRSRILAGVNSIGVFDHGSPFGFSGLYGPTVGLRSEYYVNGRTSLAFEAAYSFYSLEAFLFRDRTVKLAGFASFHRDNLSQWILGTSYSSSVVQVGNEAIDHETILLNLGFSL